MRRIVRFWTVAAWSVFMTIYGASADDGAKDAKAAPPDRRTLNPAELNLPARFDDLMADLAAPLHNRSLREKGRNAVRGREADLASGYSLQIIEPCATDVGVAVVLPPLIHGCSSTTAAPTAASGYVLQLGDPHVAQTLETSVADFRKFMAVCMEVQRGQGAYPIVAVCGNPKGCPPNAPEAFHLMVSPSECRITARDAEGIRRALIHLEDEMSARRAPLLPLGEVSRWATVVDRITHSPVTPYDYLTGWELEYDDDFYPDQYLNKLMHCGINGIWVHGLLRRTVASKILPELGAPPTYRLDKLKRLTEKTARYGIKVYFFCMEPRPVSENHAVFAAHPEIRGAVFDSTPGDPRLACLCTSTKLVQQYIRETMRTLFTAAPKLGGVITIFNGERATTCWLNEKFVQTCPRCRHRTQADVLAEDLNCHLEGIRQASPTARLLAWTYLMDSTGMEQQSLDPMLDVMRRTHPEITWLVCFEHGGKKQLCGKTVGINEYSLSYVGPSEAFAKFAEETKRQGRQTYAKLQIGTTYEMGSLPELPLPGIVYDKLAAMRRLGVSGAMASWIPGGYPGSMLKALGEASLDPLPSKEEFLRRLAEKEFPPEAAGKVVRAWNLFAETFQRYPFNNSVFYFGPITRSPAYQLHLEREPRTADPYNWGLDFQRRRQPYEDQVSRWLGPFTAEELIDSFRQMGRQWQQGVDLLGECRREYPHAVALNRPYAVAAAAGVQFRSAANVIEFYTLRDRLLKSPPPRREAIVARLRRVAEEDLALAEEMKTYLAADAAIGFHSEMYNYSFSPKLLDEKIRHTRQTLETLARWQRTGIEPDVLKRSLPPAQPACLARPSSDSGDPDLLRWGD